MRKKFINFFIHFFNQFCCLHSVGCFPLNTDWNNYREIAQLPREGHCNLLGRGCCVKVVRAPMQTHDLILIKIEILCNKKTTKNNKIINTSLSLPQS